MNRDNYINITGWMVEDLGLKGNELMVYAIIYGFSQDGTTEFTGSIAYLQDWLKASKQTVVTALKNLVEKGYVEKREYEVAKNVKLCAYSTPGQKIRPPVQNLDEGCQKIRPGAVKNLDGGGLKIRPNNTIYNSNNITNKNKERFKPPTVEEVKAYCSERGNKVDAERFVDFYESKGWKVGSNPMKDWKAAVRTWEKRDSENQKPKPPANMFNNFTQRKYDYAALERALL